ncbi:MAG: carbohydrate ABC transporter permease [bacterium]|nr:carbohydrate ABC transporter permease [bacterium]
MSAVTAYPAAAPRPGRRSSHKSITRYWREWILHAVLIAIALVYIFPFVWVVGSALKTEREFFSQGINPLPPGELQWQNFQEAWIRANFSQYMFNTVFIAASVAFFSILFGSITAYTLSRLDVPGKNGIVALIGILFLLPQGYTIISTYEVMTKFRLIGSLYPVILIVTVGSIPMNTFFLYGYMRSIPGELEEASIIDGATVWQRYLYIIMPMCRPMLGTLGLFMFLKGWNEFFLSLVFTLSNPSLRTLSIGMYAFVGLNSREWTLICAGAVISILPVIILFIFLQRYFVQAFAGAIKS